MRLKNKYTLVSFLIIFCCIKNIAAQEISEEINILKSVTPIIRLSPKIQSQPIIPKYIDANPKLEYNIYDSKLNNNEINNNNILNANLIQTRSKYIPLFYAKFGIGNMHNYLANLNFNSFPSKHLKYAFNIKHRSIKGNLVSDQIINTNTIAGNFSIINPESTINIKLNYNQNLFYFYGINEPTNIYDNTFKVDSKDIKHSIRDLGLKLNFNNDTSDNPFRYLVDLNIFNLHTNRGVNENTLSLNSDVAVNNYFAFISKLDLNFIKLQNLDKKNHSIFILPHFVFNIEELNFKVGLNTNLLVNDKTQILFYPYLYTSYHIIPSYLDIFGEITGNTEILNYKKLIIINPYIDNNVNILNTNKKLNINLGINFSPNSTVQFRSVLSYYKINNLPIFVNKKDEANKFIILYANDAKALIFDSELNIVYNDKINSNLELILSDYQLQNNLKASYIPKFKASINNILEIIDNLKLNIKISYLSNQYAYIQNKFDAPQKLQSYLNLTLGAEYTFKNISIFTNVNNLLNSKYEMYKFYPGFGLNFIAGLTIQL